MNNKVANWIRRHQVLAFFILAYSITWSFLFLYYLIFHGNPAAGALLEPFVVFSPALMAMMISDIAEPLPKKENSRARWIAFILAWLFSTPILILYAWKIYEIELVWAIIVYSIIAFFPAWVLSSVYARTPGIRKLFSFIRYLFGLITYTCNQDEGLAHLAVFTFPIFLRFLPI